LRLRDVAERVGVTERAVQRIVADLEEGGYLTRHRAGRQNEYEIDTSRPMRHAVEAHQTVGALIALMGEGETPRAGAGRSERTAKGARNSRRPRR
jgi:DNA-binding Lrp family transcriptional regulator